MNDFSEPTRRTLLAALGLAAAGVLVGCSSDDRPTRSTTTSAPVRSSAPGSSSASVSPVASRLALLERTDRCRIGVFLHDTGTGRITSYRADERFPMCSTSKVLTVSAILLRDDDAALDQRVAIHASDLLEYAPITSEHVADGMTVRALCDAAIRYSDNTANNLLLERLGGPAQVTALARRLGDDVTRLDRPEPGVNTAIPGDPRDTTTPRAFAGDLSALVLGSALPAPARTSLTSWLEGNTTGATKIRAGVPSTWTVGDKTGHGDYGSDNDVAILRPPGRAPLVLTVLTTTTDKDATGRPGTVAAATRAVLAG